MARGKSTKLKPFQKLLTIMQSGKPVTIEEIEATLGNEIYMYRLSTYMWHIKTQANGIVKAIKDGRKVTAYQVVNAAEVKEYMKRAGVTSANFVPGQTTKKPSIAKLADLAAKPAKKAPAKKPAKPKKVEAVKADADSDLVIEEVQEAA
jgi:DNA-binding transcriptional ArsR family regulator